MTPARAPAQDRAGGRLLIIDPMGAQVASLPARALPSLLDPGDLVVINDAATLPASLRARSARGEELEIRLAGLIGACTWQAIVLGPGDHRTPTEARPDPPALTVGERVRVVTCVRPPWARYQADDEWGPSLEITDRDPEVARLWTVRFRSSEAAMYHAIYAHGRPVQYAHVEQPLALWSVQNGYAGAPWALELPSAGQLLTTGMLLQLRARGVGIASLTHAAGLSSSGDPALDARLPLAERSFIPEALARAVSHARARGGRVVAIGTSVVRALEDAAGGREITGELPVGDRIATLRITPEHRLAIVDGVVSGVHAPGESHYELLGALAPPALLARASQLARRQGYKTHEFGEHCLILPGALQNVTVACAPSAYRAVG